MPLRGRTPESAGGRLKALMYSPAGIGETIAAIQMLRTYIVDAEHRREQSNHVEWIIAPGCV